MDPINNYSVEKQLAELRASLKTVNSETGPLTDIHGSVSGYEPAADQSYTIGLSRYNNNVVNSGYTISSPNVSTWQTTYAANSHMSGKINLSGDEADIVINGISLMEILQDRLNIMIPNPELEKEWSELKRLGDRYRKLEKKLKKQGDMWAKLKAMPPPDLS